MPKKPFGSPPTVLDYLGRYTHRVALSNDRILQVENGEVTLSYRDRKDGDRKKIMTLEAQEFIRRFLLHVLPDGFMRIRHFGFLANRSKKQALAQCRQLLDLNPALPKSPILSAKDLLLISPASIFRAARAAMREPWWSSAIWWLRRADLVGILHEQASITLYLVSLSIGRLGTGVPGASQNSL